MSIKVILSVRKTIIVKKRLSFIKVRAFMQRQCDALLTDHNSTDKTVIFGDLLVKFTFIIDEGQILIKYDNRQLICIYFISIFVIVIFAISVTISEIFAV